MKLKLIAILIILIGYLTVMFGVSAATSLCSSVRFSVCIIPDGTNPPHAVDITGKVIPESSTNQPDKPIILAKDSQDKLRGELKLEATFDHAKHATDILYSLDGKTVTTCVECHHTSQPSAPKGQEYLETFDRKETLTAKQLETSKEPVQSCRACHFQSATEETDEYPPASVTYPKKMKKPPTGKLTNDVAYHINCDSCHEASRKRDPKLLSPVGCYDCHTKKK
ncbi:MAG: cytochrome c3 family protein [Acidobacteria bacterium]|nr:cytochrome c3 family protein [Acidobacteriota bacterium]